MAGLSLVADGAHADRGHTVDQLPNRHIRLHEIQQWVDACINLRHIFVISADYGRTSGRTFLACLARYGRYVTLTRTSAC